MLGHPDALCLVRLWSGNNHLAGTGAEYAEREVGRGGGAKCRTSGVSRGGSRWDPRGQKEFGSVISSRGSLICSKDSDARTIQFAWTGKPQFTPLCLACE